MTPESGQSAKDTTHKYSKYPLDLLVIQPTPFCNINCSYCYLPNREDSSRLNLNVLEESIRAVVQEFRLSESLQVAWHAGEPLAVPLRFYREAFELFQKHMPSGISVTHVFQTNGTLIHDGWCRLFVEANADIGLSLDGPKRFHDRHRVYRNGRGTFEDVLKGLLLLQGSKIQVHVLTVLSLESLKHPDEFYDFYKSLEVSNIAFNIEEIEGVNRSSTLNVAEAASLFKKFLGVFLQRRRRDVSSLKVREIDHILRAIVHGKKRKFVNNLTEPFSILTIDAKGYFSTFSPELHGQSYSKFSNFHLGRFDSAGAHIDHDMLDHVSKEIQAGIGMCQRECSYFPICGGGSPGNKLFEHGTFAATETLECKFRIKLVGDLVMDELRAILK